MVFTIDQIDWKVEFAVGKGSGFKGKNLKQFSSTNHENISQEKVAQILVRNDVCTGPNQSVPLEV